MESTDETQPLLENKENRNIEANVIDSEKDFKANNIGVINYLAFGYVILSLGCSAELGSAQVIPQYVFQTIDGTYSANSSSNNGALSDSNSSGSYNNCNGSSHKNEKQSQEEASEWMLYLKLMEDGLELFGITIFGVCSDFIGRKPLILMCLTGITLRYGGIAFIIYMNLDKIYLFIPYGIAGLFGNYSVCYIAMFSMIADITKRDQNRTIFLALFDLILGIGVAGAQIGAGYLIHEVGYLFPLLLATGLAFSSLISALLFIKETANKIPTSKLSVFEGIKRITTFFRDKSSFIDNTRWKYFICLIALSFYRLAEYSTTIDTLYELGSPFCWSSESIGYFSATTSFLQLTVGLAFIKLFHVCLVDESIAFIGCLSAIAYRTLTGLADHNWMLYLATSTGVMAKLPAPILRAIVSRMVTDDKQGALFANYYVIDVICKLCSTSISNNVYASTQDFMKGFVFFVMAGLYSICALLFIPLVVTSRPQSKEYTIQT